MTEQNFGKTRLVLKTGERRTPAKLHADKEKMAAINEGDLSSGVC